MRNFFKALAALSGGVAVFGVWIVWSILHSPGDDNPFAFVGEFLCIVGVFFALVFAWTASRLQVKRDGR